MSRYVREIPILPISDDRGTLVSFEEQQNVPFGIRRVYCLVGNERALPRGFHAHKQLKQLLVCLKGSCMLVLDDGFCRREFALQAGGKALLVAGLVWREIFELSSGDVLMVLASEAYSEKDYVRDYEVFAEQAVKMERVL